MGMFDDKPLYQFKKPEGELGKTIIASMNESHYNLTTWGLSNVTVKPTDTVLDVGCGGGRTVSRLKERAYNAKVYGIDYSAECVRWANEYNKEAVSDGKVEILNASVDKLPFDEGKFDIVFAVETTYFWPDLEAGFKEICRVLKKGGRFVIINEAYTSLTFKERNDAYWAEGKMKIFSPKEFRKMLLEAGFSDTDIVLNPQNNWITCTAIK